MKEYVHPTGSLWDGGGFKIRPHTCDKDDVDKCSHWKEGKEILIVIATNEGGYNSTEVCLECIKEAAKKQELI